MQNNKINLKEKFSLFSKYWAPHIIAEMNDHQFKLVKIKGEFIWHEHKNSDETFIVVEGKMEIKFPRSRGRKFQWGTLLISPFMFREMLPFTNVP